MKRVLKEGFYMKYEIKLAQKENVLALVELLNIVTLNLHRKNINQWSYPWDTQIIERDIKNKNTYMISEQDKIVGTFSIKSIGTENWIPSVNRDDLYLYRIAILTEYQGNNIGLQAIDYACQISRNLKKTLYLDCWSGNEKLKAFYSKVGFSYCGDFPEEDYKISVFKFE
jgi:ribosomal protein S18 acetylase RimI-like enzyme